MTFSVVACLSLTPLDDVDEISWQIVWLLEVDGFASSVLSHEHPGVHVSQSLFMCHSTVLGGHKLFNHPGKCCAKQCVVGEVFLTLCNCPIAASGISE